ncbi:hypothetical protein RHMOL_Rhmol02G0188900 [Rhododendron molle]|uniref:Uncharacterized protein n=1 Tax=Rhododendron molle TaxID=49168 RepID=A0ACC0PS42_RHOML|nr:hypothetical protein RHMOL_Rhmol02G0188900 [Rhododendron molle]
MRIRRHFEFNVRNGKRHRQRHLPPPPISVEHYNEFIHSWRRVSNLQSASKEFRTGLYHRSKES